MGFLSAECGKCGSTEHATSDCPHGFFSSKCDKCGSTEHATSDCPHGFFSSKRSSSDQKKTSIRRETTSSDSSSSDGSGLAWLVGGVIVVIVVIWLAVNVVLPVALLNSALALTILALFDFRQRKTLFAALALIGGCYMLLDIVNGWFSVNFVNNVVKDPNWIRGFAYINAAAIGLSTWLLVQPIWAKARLIETSDKRKSIILTGASILLVAIATTSVPIVFHSVQNPFTQNTVFKSASSPARTPALDTKAKPPTPSINITKAVIAVGLDSSQNPMDINTNFPSGQKRLHCCVSYNGAIADSTVFDFRWFKDGNQISSQSQYRVKSASSTNTCNRFNYNFEPGEYEARLFVNGNNINRTAFSVSANSADIQSTEEQQRKVNQKAEAEADKAKAAKEALTKVEGQEQMDRQKPPAPPLFRKGAAEYTDNGNGTIKDKTTGLTWQKGENPSRYYNWYRASGTYDATYNPSSQNVCGSLNLVGGGWRLPTLTELSSLVDTNFFPSINTNFFPNAQADMYWSSTPNASNRENFLWVVYFNNGSVQTNYKDNNLDVRCVRGGQVNPDTQRAEEQQRKTNNNKRPFPPPPGEIDTPEIKDYLAAGRKYFDMGKYELCISKMEEVLKRDKNHPIAIQHIRMANEKINNIKKQFRNPTFGGSE